jgi:hypothetical protein
LFTALEFLYNFGVVVSLFAGIALDIQEQATSRVGLFLDISFGLTFLAMI